MSVTDRDEARVIALLDHDVEATLGLGYASDIRYHAAALREILDEPSQYVDKVVEDVQQFIHDTFVDTTWPACPRHPNHPLWHHEGGWRCEKDDVVVARLGELSRRGG